MKHSHLNRIFGKQNDDQEPTDEQLKEIQALTDQVVDEILKY